MNLSWGSAHFSTLCKLVELARKHDCTIGLYTLNINENEINGIPDYFKLSKKAEAVLIDSSNVRNPLHKYCSVCLELQDNANHTINQFIFSDESFQGKISCDYELELISDEIKRELGIQENGFFEIEQLDHTVINGFNGIKKNYGCYREGMVVEYFGDMVCDYLKEPRIKEVY